MSHSEVEMSSLPSMADSKYAGLPGIAYDQPDVYETSDLPESDQDYLTESDTGSTAVEVLHISSNEAHSQFKDKILDANLVDFSDRISYSRRRGYDARRMEWEVAGTGEEETLMQKYQRLNCEVNDLVSQVHAVKGTIPCGDGNASSVELANQVENLQGVLGEMKLEETLGTEVCSSLSQPQVVLQKKLLNLLEGFKKTGLVSEKGDKSAKQKTDGTAGASSITYELYYAPEHARLNQLAGMAALENKIDKLETLIGNNPDKLSSLSAWTNHKSIVGALQVLSSRLALLEPVHLDHIEGRLHAVHTRMNSISEKKAAIDDADKQSKVTELYELVKKTEALSSAVPDVVDRLVSLEALHDQAIQFSSSIKQLDLAQSRLSSVLGSNTDHLTAVKEKFSQNLEIIQTNISNLDNRLKALGK